MIKYLRPAMLIVSVTLLSWLMMQAVHELGHILGALVGGGTINNVVLHPLAFSRTDVQPNPHPLIEVWCGPIVGTAIPLIIWFVLQLRRWQHTEMIRFFAGFCCLANGIYIAFGPGGSGGMDSQLMLRLGCARWQLLLFGIPMVCVGLALWHRISSTFAVRRQWQAKDSQRLKAAVLALVCVVLLELVLG